ncbi:GntR family transcriptional regulator [Nocardioides sp. 1609]|uniref:GntR family transcriptional regulator n=1 Tax=Nocardioides sp. 1609 TaxID=2508327 RepID=UPI00106FB36F|nr:GntR family transcriptional regulator [Nocardioides sp. 1609]
MQGSRRRSPFTAHLVNSVTDGGAPHVVDDMRRAILAGDEPPGTLIPIDAVAQFFGCSQIPVREALKVLIGEGLVDHVPRVGYSVAQLTFAEFSELYDVRQALESSALRAAAPRATPADHDVVRRTHEAMADAVASGDERAYHRASRLFHLALIEPAGMARLTHMYTAAWNMTEPARPMARVDDHGRAAFHHEHDRMLGAFVAGDPETLVAESDAHYAHLKAEIARLRDDPALFRSAPAISLP